MNVDYHGRRATIMGLGHFGGGAAAARWLARQGAIVTVSDLADENALADSLAMLADVPIAAFSLGGHREEDFREAELVVVNPAVRPDSPGLQFARQCGARLVTELELFMENCPAPMIGVTGTNGKSTTAAMIASILKAGGQSSPRPLGEGQGVRATWRNLRRLKIFRSYALTLTLSQREKGPISNALARFFWAAISAAACWNDCPRSAATIP